jgi:hypothetical protein
MLKKFGLKYDFNLNLEIDSQRMTLNIIALNANHNKI